MRRERERIGPFVVTGKDNLSPLGIICANCQKQLAIHDKAADGHIPSIEEILGSGAVAWSNFGWFCSSGCEDAYAKEFNVRLERIARTPGMNEVPTHKPNAG